MTNAVEVAKQTVENYEGKRIELQNKLVELDTDIRRLNKEIEADFQSIVMNGGIQNEKLRTELSAVQGTREQVLIMLGNMDNLLQGALEGMRGQVEADRDKVFAEIRKQEEALADEIKTAKLNYLQSLVKQHELIMDASGELGAFRDIETRLGIRPIDMRTRRLVDFDMAQSYYKGFHPIVTVEDVRKAYFGELEYHAEQYAEQK
ncbi:MULTISPECIES: hypothetical protein [Bacillus]|uniref:Uncharacterized protein n=1 Tax=Bacillus cereus TaxID=1396 RepID=A0A2A8IXV8_BACCE|nr:MULTISPECIES: hypothetical protein [Bacillus]PER24549.1 hypothetical protein CN476_15910 [Bacillus cereus]PFA64890.1 hypothetical protein CN402_02665 [Bacillus sp. AFS015896]PGL84487.1 hypothetical protein CN931_11545 [Bacillus sp. AFS054943]PGU05759.1 hypothetical protein COD19_05970 [Bacillus cereus]